MPTPRAHARWSEAVPLTVGLWLFVLIIFMPVLIRRHDGDGLSIVLDGSTVLLSMLFGFALFALFRSTLGWPPIARSITLALGVAWASLTQLTFDLLFTGWVAANLQASWSALPVNLSRAYGSLFNYLAIFSMNLALFQLSFLRNRSLNQERQLAAARSAAQQAQLEALRLQLNPHFLFNTLNAISAMIVTNRNADAELMTERLCSFLRASLSFDPTELVPLDEEIALVEDYLEIEQVRFGERLIVEIECDAAARAVPVPGLLIQPLVENAIKYDVARSRKPVTLAIRAKVSDGALRIEVANDGESDGRAAPHGTGVGQKNIRRRLAGLYGGRASFSAGPADPGYASTICIPVEEAAGLPARQTESASA